MTTGTQHHDVRDQSPAPWKPRQIHLAESEQDSGGHDQSGDQPGQVDMGDIPERADRGHRREPGQAGEREGRPGDQRCEGPVRAAGLPPEAGHHECREQGKPGKQPELIAIRDDQPDQDQHPDSQESADCGQ